MAQENTGRKAGESMGIVKGKDIIKPDGRLKEACIALRDYVEHLGKRADSVEMRDKIHTVKLDGVEIGYKVTADSPLAINPYFTRTVIVHTPGWNMLQFKASELAAIKTAVFDAFFSDVQIMPQFLSTGKLDCIAIQQRFEVASITRGENYFGNRDMVEKGLVIG